MSDEQMFMGMQMPLPKGYDAAVYYDEARPAYVLRITGRDAAGRPFAGERRFDLHVVRSGQRQVFIDGGMQIVAFVKNIIEREGARVQHCSHVGADDSCCVACGRRIPSGRQQRCAFVDPNSGEVLSWIEDPTEDETPAFEFLLQAEYGARKWQMEYKAEFIPDPGDDELMKAMNAEIKRDKAGFYKRLFGGR